MCFFWNFLVYFSILVVGQWGYIFSKWPLIFAQWSKRLFAFLKLYWQSGRGKVRQRCFPVTPFPVRDRWEQCSSLFQGSLTHSWQQPPQDRCHVKGECPWTLCIWSIYQCPRKEESLMPQQPVSALLQGPHWPAHCVRGWLDPSGAHAHSVPALSWCIIRLPKYAARPC